MVRLAFLFGILLTALSVRAEDLVLPITADNCICLFPGEQADNCGQASHLKLKGMENMILFNFDTKALQGKKVTKAFLKIKGNDKKLMIHKVGFSTVASAWNEGKQDGEKKAADGDSNYLSPNVGSGKLWAGPGSSFLDAIHGRGGTIWSQSFSTHDDKDWYEMEIDPRLIEACAAGISYGLCLSDDAGQAKAVVKEAYANTNNGNNFFYSHEQSNAKPELHVTVEAAGGGKIAPPLDVTVKPWIHGANFETGGLEVTWKNENKDFPALGYKIVLDIDGKGAQEQPVWVSPSPVAVGETARALIKNLPADASVKVVVKEYLSGLGGSDVASGEVTGKVSAKLAQPEKLELKGVERALGEAPSNAVAKVWGLPDGCKANPITGNVLEESGVPYEGDAKGVFAQGNASWSGKDRTIYLSSIKGEWVGFQVVCQNAGKEPVEYKITPSGLNGPNGTKISAEAFEISKLWYQKVGKSDRGWYADPLLPIAPGSTFKVPDEKNAVPNQANQTIYAEFFVPKDAAPGQYNGVLLVKAGDAEPLELKIQLDVGNAKIPEQTAFVWSMNAYSSPGGDFGKTGSDEFIKAEQDFYKDAHAHRTCLAVLHYGHGGNHHEGAVPPIGGKGKDAKVSDWSMFDKRFGPLLDGSAFKGTPREGVPMDHFYLGLSEHYPVSMAEGYKWNNILWEEHWLKAGWIQDGFTPEYKDAWVSVAADQMKHFKEKNYGTTFQIYLNDKYFYKQWDLQKKGPGNGVCFWLLDEPMHIDDYTALEFFAKLFKQAKTQAGPEAAKTSTFRADISRPQWGRDVLDRDLELNVSGAFGDYRPWLEEWRERYGQRIWTYGGAPSSTQSALGICFQGLDLYGRGVDGFVPWLTLGGEKNWKSFEDTCVYYPGKPFGIQGACASLRLKAYRRAEQDIEYIKLLAEKRGLLKNDPNRTQVNKLLQGAIQVSKKKGTLDAQGAEVESFGGLKPDDFENLRRAIKAAL